VVSVSVVVGNDKYYLQIYLNYFRGVYIRKEDCLASPLDDSIGL
jgi:hypothetical protein